MCNADSSVSRTLITNKAMLHPGASWGCSKALTKQLCTARDKNSYSLRLTFRPCQAQIHLRTARGNAEAGFWLAVISLLCLLWCWWFVGILSYWWGGWLVAVEWSGVCRPHCLPVPSERDDPLRIHHSASAEVATLLLWGKSKPRLSWL